MNKQNCSFVDGLVLDRQFIHIVLADIAEEFPTKNSACFLSTRSRLRSFVIMEYIIDTHTPRNLRKGGMDLGLESERSSDRLSRGASSPS